MQTVLSNAGVIVLPAEARKLLGLKTGARLAVTVENGEIRLTPCLVPARKVKIAEHPASGLPHTPLGRHAPELTAAEIRRALATQD